MPHLKVSGKGGRTRYLPLHPGTHGLINDYLDAAGHGLDEAGALFRPVQSVMAAQTPFRERVHNRTLHKYLWKTIRTT